MTELRIKVLHPDAKIPAYQTDGSAGMDLHSTESVRIHSMETVVVGTGIAMAIPAGYEGQVRPRSGLAAKHGITVLNSPGTIDSDYRGELKVILTNTSKDDYEVCVGDRIAQIVLARVHQLSIVETETLDATDRGSGGFGSTGQ